MAASRQVEIPFQDVMVDNVDEVSVHLQKLLGELQFLFCVNIRPSCKTRGCNLLEPTAPNFAEISRGGKNFKTDAKSMGRQTLRKQLGNGSRKRSASEIIPTKTCKTNPSVAKRQFYKQLSFIMLTNFRY